MEIGDLIRISKDWREMMFYGKLGVATNIYIDPEDDYAVRMVTVLWENGETSEEWFVALEVVCK
jgi:hypothetical protein